MALTFGSFQEFEAAAVSYISYCNLDATHVVVVYQDEGNSNKPTACLGTVSGDSIAFETPVVFDATSNFYSPGDVKALSSTSFIVVYPSTTGGFKTKAIVGTISGTTITFGDVYTLVADYPDYGASIGVLDSTHAIILWSHQTETYAVKSCIATISNGDDISFGTVYTVFNARGTWKTSVAVLSSTVAVLIYEDNTTPYYGKSKVATISGSSISLGNEYNFYAGTTYDSHAATIDSTHFLIMFNGVGASDLCGIVIGTVSGTAISFGSVINLITGNNFPQKDIIYMGDNNVVITYSDGGDANKFKCKNGIIASGNITFSDATIINTNRSYTLSATKLSNTKFSIAFDDGADSRHGKAIVGNYPSLFIPQILFL